MVLGKSFGEVCWLPSRTRRKEPNRAGCQHFGREVTPVYRGPRGVGGRQISGEAGEERAQPAVGEQIEGHPNTRAHGRAGFSGDTNPSAGVQPVTVQLARVSESRA